MDIEITSDTKRIDAAVVHRYLSEESYWAAGRTREKVEAILKQGLHFGVLNDKSQTIGYARVISDFLTIYYLADVFILPEYQGQGIGKRLMEHILNHPDLIDLVALLITKDAMDFYKPYGFQAVQERNRTAMIVTAAERRNLSIKDHPSQ
ncbi:MAG: GNAT family N-acetyltransferase [Leptospiraceae bacterium]|nr:GNAT family N-acetyltransferase [Leptospiraceae bacterium]MCB1303585.1 GNAT family N-acetyltransferase [Leptospiraceae bacterium]